MNRCCSKVLLLLTVALLAFGCGGGSSPSSGPSTPGFGGGNSAVPQVAHVFVVVEENHSFSEVVGNPDLPYFNSLVAAAGLSTQYYANAHPSLPNYFMLTTGATITDSDSFTGTVSQDNVVRALTSAGKSWKCYAESLPSAGYLGSDVGAFLRHHVPFAYVSDVQNNPAQAANIVPFTQFAIDLASGNLPSYSFIVPNIYDDAHSCPGGATTCSDTQKLTAADAWLQSNLDALIKSPAFQDSLIIITFDESEISDTQYGGGHIATVIVSAKTRPAYRSSTFYQHQSTLRLTMKALGVLDFPGAAATVPDMGEFFQ
jgi:phosphatidylinositol-3-phosphatase